VATERLWATLFSRRMLACVLLGFSSGLPLYVLQALLPAWLRTEGVSLRDIGLFSLVGLPYVWKFVWAPLTDRFVPPFLGRRRGWAILTQVALLGLIAGFGALDPRSSTLSVAVLAFGVALFGATQDIALDAFRRELLSDAELGFGNALFVNGYRVAGLVPGALALILADRMPWPLVHAFVAAFMAIGIVTTLLVREIPAEAGTPTTLREAVVGPFREFFGRSDLASALRILAFLFFYKLGDSMATALATPFYLDMGFSMTEIGSVAKLIGFWATIGGSLVGGAVMTRIGINKALWAFGVVQVVSILGFALLAVVGRSIPLLGAVVLFEYLGVGLGTSAFVAFIARATDRRFTATQFALFSGFIALPRTVANASTGFIVEAVGYPAFFLTCTALALPGMALLLKVAPWRDEPA
jgi:MFS transporter, PAT family, beta-lactamase induction signal transducer AmpG